MKKSLVLAGLAAVCVMSTVGTSHANQTGLAGMHAQAIVKGRLCFTGHTHVGSGSAHSKRQAVAMAANDWSSFTSFEYGSSWAQWRRAIAKKVACTPSSAKWTCEVQARPCLNGKRRRARQARR